MLNGRPLEGVRVVEVTLWGFVPSAAAILADWGATVLKVEHPEHGDPMRGLVTSGLMPGGAGVNFMWEFNNRNKRGVGIDLAQPEGREALYKLVEGADVFLTSFLPDARRRLGIDIQSYLLRNVNARIEYCAPVVRRLVAPTLRGGFGLLLLRIRHLARSGECVEHGLELAFERGAPAGHPRRDERERCEERDEA